MGDVFNLDDVQQISLTVGGESSTVDVPHGATLRSFVSLHASAAGIRTFTVYVDGDKATTEQGGMSLAGISSIEIVPKDSRG